MKKIIIMSITLLCAMTALYAQRSKTPLEQVNDIKRQTNVYVWNHFTDTNAETAIANAESRLLEELCITTGKSLTMTDIQPYTKLIKLNRGNLVEAFVYIARASVPGLSSELPEPEPTPVPRPITFEPDMFVQKIMQQQTFLNVYNFLKDQKSQGVVQMFGALKEVEDYSSLDLIVFDLSSKQIITILSAVQPDGSRTNLNTGAKDALDNYPTEMVAVIYYIK